jgi:hypothetical protein
VAARYDIISAGENLVTVVASSGSFDRLEYFCVRKGLGGFVGISADLEHGPGVQAGRICGCDKLPQGLPEVDRAFTDQRYHCANLADSVT